MLAGLFLVAGLAAARPARAVAVRLRDPGADRGLRATTGGSARSRSPASCWPRSTCCWMYQRTMTGPARPGVEPDHRPRPPRGRRARPAAAGAGAVRLLPDAAARRDQPDRRRRSSSNVGVHDPAPDRADAAEAPRRLITDATSSSPPSSTASCAPLLVVFGVACLGVLVEAFVPARAPLPRPGRARHRRPRRRPRRRRSWSRTDLDDARRRRRARHRSPPRAPSPSTARPSSSGA